MKIGETVWTAAMSKFGWDSDEATGKRVPRAPGRRRTPGEQPWARAHCQVSMPCRRWRSVLRQTDLIQEQAK